MAVHIRRVKNAVKIPEGLHVGFDGIVDSGQARYIGAAFNDIRPLQILEYSLFRYPAGAFQKQIIDNALNDSCREPLSVYGQIVQLVSDLKLRVQQRLLRQYILGRKIGAFISHIGDKFFGGFTYVDYGLKIPGVYLLLAAHNPAPFGPP